MNIKKWQIQTKNGFMLGIFEGVTPQGALDKLAQSKQFNTFKEWHEYLGLSASFEASENRIII